MNLTAQLFFCAVTISVDMDDAGHGSFGPFAIAKFKDVLHNGNLTDGYHIRLMSDIPPANEAEAWHLDDEHVMVKVPASAILGNAQQPRFAYYLLAFDAYPCLDNSIFSGNQQAAVDMNNGNITKNISQTVESHTAEVSWNIAMSGIFFVQLECERSTVRHHFTIIAYVQQQ